MRPNKAKYLIITGKESDKEKTNILFKKKII